MARFLVMRQVAKRGNQADFQLESDGFQVGELHYQSQGIMNGYWTGEALGQTIRADYACRRDRSCGAFGVFDVNLPHGGRGRFYAGFEGGLLRRFTTYVLEIPEGKICMYDVAMGKEGYKFPVWQGDRQIALAEKPSVTYNALFTFDVSAIDDQSAYYCILLLMNLYVRKYYEPNTVNVQSVHSETGITVYKELKNRYNPDFLMTLRNK